MISRVRGACSRLLLDNPMVLRELTQRLGGGRLAAGIALAALLQGAALSIAMAFYLDFGRRQAGFSLGGMAFLFWTYSLLIFVVCSAPIRAYGLFDWERRKESLDQHITSGSSPVVTIAGKSIVCAIYGLEIVVASVPFALLVSMFGGVESGWIVEALVLTLAFAFMLLGFSVWGSMIEPEIGVAIAVFLTGSLILLFAPLFSWELSELACLFPTFPAYHHFGESLDLTRGALQPLLFGHEIPGAAIGATLYVVLGLLGLAMGAIGPVPAAGALACTYGTLISDRRRRWRRWLGSFMSRRRADLRFLYENRPRWLRRTEPVLREGHALAVALPVAILGFGLFWHEWSGSAGSHDFLALNLTVAIFLTVAAVMRAAIPREELLGRGGRIRLRAAFWASFVMMLLPVGVLRVAGLLDSSGLQASSELCWALVLVLGHGMIVWTAGVMLSCVAGGRVKVWVLQAAIAGIIALGFPLAAVSLARIGIWNELSVLAMHLSAPVVIDETLFGDGVKTQGISIGESYSRVRYELHQHVALGLALGMLLVVGAVARISLAASRSRQAKSGKPLKLLSLVAAVTLVSAAASAQGREAEAGPKAQGDRSSPRISLVAGFENIVPPSGFVPITVLVTGGGEAFQGVLLVTGGDDESRVLWRGDVDLAPGSSRRVRLLVSSDSLDGGGEVAASLLAHGGAGAHPRASARAFGGANQERSVLFVDRRLPQPVGSNPSAQQSFSPLGAAPEQLPEHAPAYWGLQAIVLGRLSPGDLEPAQLEAIRVHVASGGTLVLTTGQRTGNLDPAVLGDLASGLDGVTPGALRQRVECISGLGLDPEKEQLLDLADLRPLLDRGASPVLAEAGVPLAVERRHGRGRIVVAAFDPWEPPLELSQTNAALALALSTHPLQRPTAATSGRIAWMGDATSGILFVVLASLLALAATAVLPYVAARLAGRPLLTWWLAPLGAALAVVCIIAASSSSLGTRSDVAVDTMTWWPEAGSAVVREIHVSVASKGRNEAELVLPGAYRELEQMNDYSWRWNAVSAGAIVPAFPDAAGETTEVSELELGRWQTRQLHGASLLDDPAPMRARLQLDPEGGGRLEIEGLDRPVQELVLMVGGRREDLGGDLQPGDHSLEVSRTLMQAGSDAGTWIARAPRERSTRAQVLRYELIQSMINAYSAIGMRYYGQVRAGVTRGSPARLFAVIARSGPGLPGRQDLRELDGVDLISVPVALRLPPGAEVELPGSIVEYRSLSTITVEEPTVTVAGSAFSLQSETWVVTSATLPACEPTAAVVAAELDVGPTRTPRPRGNLTVATRGQAPGSFVQFWNWQDQEWQDLQVTAPVTSQAGSTPTPRVEGAMARALFEPGSGRLLLRVPESMSGLLEGGLNPWDQSSGPIRSVKLQVADR